MIAKVVGAWTVGVLIGLGLSLLVALVGAVPVMWLAGYLHDNGMSIVPAFGYGEAWVIALLLAWISVFTTSSGGSSS